MQEFVPGNLVLPRNVAHIDDRETCVHAEFGGIIPFGIRSLFIGVCKQRRHLLRRLDLRDRRRIGRPVAAGHIGDLIFLVQPIVDIHILELVLDAVARCFAVTIGAVVKRARELLRLRGIARHGVAVLIRHALSTLRRENVVECIVHIVADRDIVVAL